MIRPIPILTRLIRTAAVCASLVSLTLGAAERPSVKQRFAVRTVKVARAQAAPSQTNYGYIKAEDNRVYDVVPRFSGYIETLYANTRYAYIKRGQPLANIYSPEVLQAKEDYLNALRYDAKRPNKAMLRSTRSKLQLLGVSKNEIDRIVKTGRVSELTTLYAPVSGWIFEKHVNQGSAFKNGAMLFRIVNLDKVWIEAKLYQKQLTKLATLTRFTFRATGADGNFSAEKRLLLPNIDPDKATATLRLEADNPNGRLIPGMFVTITASPRAQSDLTLPRTAVIRKDGTWYAFIVGEYEGEYEPVEIDVEPLDRHRYRILSGLSEGDEVVDDALFMMDSDAQINGLY